MGYKLKCRNREVTMVRMNKKMKKILAVLAASLCMTLQGPAVYASGPSGPASDPLVAEQNRNDATGPGAVFQDSPAGGQTVKPPDEEQKVQPQPPAAGQETQPQPPAAEQETQPQPPAAEPETQPQPPEAEQESTAGKVKSGGRWIDPTKPMVALTFDDGPYAPVGNRIMDSLEKYNGRATFFVVGNRVSTYKTEIKRMYDNGHEIGNHTYEHKYLTKLNAAEIRSQIDRCNSAVAAVTGEAPKLVRLPGGLKNATVLANVKYPMIMWNIDTLDWKTRNAQSTYDAVIGKVKDGDIILMHEIHVPSGDAAVRIIPDLAAQGFQLVTVSELARFRGGVSAGGLYSRFRP